MTNTVPLPTTTYPPPTATSITTVIGNRASIGFDAWETALAAAMVTALSHYGVKVNKVAAEWVVSWDSPVTYNPPWQHWQPTSPQPTWICATGTN